MSRMELRCLWCFLVLSCFLQTLSADKDFFTSIGQMTDLLYTENDLVSSLKDYISAEENKLGQVKQWAEKLDSLTATAMQDPEEFLGHPVNAFKLMKRLNTEWGDLESLVLRDTTAGFISNLTLQRQHFPTDEDQTGAAKALLRLQDTYRLDANTISTGDLPGVTYKSSMTVEDCFELGKIAYSDVDYYHTELWMAQALRQLDQGEESTVDKVTVLDYLCYSIYQQGQLDQALELTKRLLKLDPEHQHANGNLKYFEFQLEKRRKAEVEAGVQKEGKERGKRQSEAHRPRQSRLFCRYFNNHRHPWYLLGPVKQEDEWDRPYIVRYIDIMSHSEIEKVKELAKPRLRRATISNPITGVLETAPYRISKSAWLTGYEHPLIETINQRIEDLTGLEMDTAEELQVANYGVGGQYETHFDFGRGSAVFWYNLFPSGEGDYRTRHAACPVLVGNKWVSNKWIHERGQEFRRPCSLQETER